jgi:indolepyruvate ferredoxin oxidoreductase alpha subunit
MGKTAEFLCQKEAGSEIMMGNTAIVRAMIETGVQVATSYPGSPTPEIADAIAALPKDKTGLYFEFSTNEKVATEVAFGASINGLFSCVFFKSVGLNVAADSFVQLGLMELIGGMVIILGDDPGANSSQNEQDNRHYARLAYIPVFEPTNPTEVISMFHEAAKLSKERKMPVILRLTTHVCHAKERVSFNAIKHETPVPETLFNPANGPYIPITSLTFPMKRKALQKLAAVKEYADNSPSLIISTTNSDRGIITAGLPYLSLLDTLNECKEKPDILKTGLVFPLPEKKIIEFLKTHKEVKIIEELDDFMEQKIKALAFENKINTTIIGKTDDEEWLGEYTADKIREILQKTWPNLLAETAPETNLSTSPADICQRPAQMCPGCGHRSAFYAISQVLKETDITVADIGCHTLGFLPPYNIGQMLLCMGHSCGTAAGLSLFNNTRRVIAFLGDSTFFHAGIPGIVNAIYNNHNITLVIMENGTTAMTGHQELPSTGQNFREATKAIPVRKVLEGLGVEHIFEVDTYQQAKLKELLEEALKVQGFSVLIAKHPCMLKFTRAAKRKGKPDRPPVMVDEKCNLQNKCIADFACPSYQKDEKTGRVSVHNDLCIGDGSCIQVCPSKAIRSTKK